MYLPVDVSHQVYLYFIIGNRICQTKLVYDDIRMEFTYSFSNIEWEIKDNNTVTLFTIFHVLKHYFSFSRFRLLLMLTTPHAILTAILLACKQNWLRQLRNFANSKWDLPAALQTNPISWNTSARLNNLTFYLLPFKQIK